MKPLSEELVSEFEQLALLGCKTMRQALTYQGDNPRYYQQGKLGAIAVTNYTRARATEANRMAIELMTRKQEQRLIGDASGDK